MAYNTAIYEFSSIYKIKPLGFNLIITIIYFSSQKIHDSHHVINVF